MSFSKCNISLAPCEVEAIYSEDLYYINSAQPKHHVKGGFSEDDSVGLVLPPTSLLLPPASIYTTLLETPTSQSEAVYTNN